MTVKMNAFDNVMATFGNLSVDFSNNWLMNTKEHIHKAGNGRIVREFEKVAM